MTRITVWWEKTCKLNAIKDSDDINYKLGESLADVEYSYNNYDGISEPYISDQSNIEFVLIACDLTNYECATDLLKEYIEENIYWYSNVYYDEENGHKIGLKLQLLKPILDYGNVAVANLRWIQVE
jgi:hypothetical protein